MGTHPLAVTYGLAPGRRRGLTAPERRSLSFIHVA